ncbi:MULTISPECIES: bacterioferritin [Methylomonas]|uniref:Bacterioferritin n=1 Tax=Methylomonas koyamae TaxID=702114 RepID=A0A177NRT3_9GAMM|nr:MULTISPECIES: bacterioferritin [Methylomonas]ANE54693.1 bacterioferritin [Methylomonas sp. DH-1]ATG89372.1 bacterioferritin [Methylomonas koyamae]OAI19939.1 bacterioferritin [Methylomonas koyamae]OAI29856.1 bacterioferritin [Methylomonas koyamae]WNB74925.1 bacterioferritin [Methylomonas koyamae]
MQGDKQVIAYLNELLAGELTAIDQYFIHSRMYQNWGLDKLYERISHEVQDETNHADALIKRILFLEGTPDLSKREPLAVGATVPEMLQNDLAVELKVVADLRKVMAYCESVRDYQTREILKVMLDDTEIDHAHWLEKQLSLIEMVGLENYLQSQI